MAEGKSGRARMAGRRKKACSSPLPLAETDRLALLGRLTGGVIHDFKNLLTAILLFSDLLENGVPRESAQARYIEEIRAAVRRGDRLIAYLLGWARHQNPEPRLISVDALLADIREMLQRLLGAEVVLTLRCTAPATQIRMDSAQMEQVILNLAMNARDAMVAGGPLTIETAAVRLDSADVRRWSGIGAGLEPGTYFRMDVKDVGCGMDESTRARAFEPFFTTKSGTGLGLSTVHAVIAQNGGSIAIDTSPGSGTTVSILLPAVKQQGTSIQRAPQTVPRSVPAGSETILLVEGDSVLRAATARMLQDCGYRVLAAGDGGEALNMARGNRGIQLVVTEIALPGERSGALVRQVSRLLPRARILFLGADDLYSRKLQRAGRQVLQKPFSKVALAVRVRGLLDGVTVRDLATRSRGESVGLFS